MYIYTYLSASEAADKKVYSLNFARAIPRIVQVKYGLLSIPIQGYAAEGGSASFVVRSTSPE